MSMDKSIHQVHVAVLAFPFGSHARPLMNLVLKLAKSAPNILFSFFNTQKSNDSLVSSSDLDLSINFKLYNVEDGVPAGHQLTGNPLEPLELFLKVADENLRRKLEMVVAETGINITCLMTDAFFSFADEIAEKFHASWIPVWISMPCCLSAHVYTRIIRKRFNNGEIRKDQSLDFIPGLFMMRLKDLPPEVFSQDLADSVFSKTLAQIGESFSKATAVGVSSFQEVNPEALNNDLRSKFKNYLNLGFLAVRLPLPPPPSSDSDLTGCLSWLDRQPPKSVAYISFGTVAALPENELKALAEALEISKNPFLWSLKDSFKQNLPTGFVERTSKQGKIVAWAPQAPVLDHNAIAVFLTHAGSISVWESVVCGVPMICRPFFGDHMMVGRMVEEAWGVGLTVENGVITTNGLLKNLEIFLRADDEIGKKMRENVQELRKVVLMAAQPSGSAATDFNKLMEIISVA